MLTQFYLHAEDRKERALELPNLPTDNLYKFLALSGLGILILSVVYPEMRLLELKEKVVELQVGADILSREKKALGEDVRRLEKDVTRLEKRTEDLEGRRRVSDASVRALETTHAQLKARREEITRRMEELEQKTIRLAGKRELVEYVSKQIERIMKGMYLGLGVGSLLMSFGFALWYGRVQKLQDLLLKKESEKTT